jgi:hypothetical protein
LFATPSGAIHAAGYSYSNSDFHRYFITYWPNIVPGTASANGTVIDPDWNIVGNSTIYLDGNDVYITAMNKDVESPDLNRTAIYINGVKNLASKQGNIGTEIMGFYVKDGHWVAAGQDPVNSVSHPTIWRDNVEEIWDDINGRIINLRVFNGDYYYTGQRVNAAQTAWIPGLWKNNKESELNYTYPLIGTRGPYCQLNDVFVEPDGTVHAVGITYGVLQGTNNINYSFPIYWKNGVFHRLTTEEIEGHANQIIVHDGIIYILGRGGYYAYAPCIYKSTDNGATFTQIYLGDTEYRDDWAYSMAFIK